MENNVLGQEIKRVRKSKGFYQYEIAEFLGIDRSTYASFETGRRKLSIITFLRVCQFLDVSYTHFMDILISDLKLKQFVDF